MLLFKPSMAAQSLPKTLIFSSTQSPNAHRASLDIAKSMVMTERTATTTTLAPPQRRTVSASEARISLVFALASQASSVSQRLLMDLASETAKYVFPKRFESRNLEEALMAVPDLETVRFKVLSRTDQYEIRVVEPYFIAETTMPGKTGFDFNGASQSFNVLAEYLFGKGFVTDEEVKRRELKLRDALKNDRQFQVKEGASVEVGSTIHRLHFHSLAVMRLH
ncbi:Soul heme-binding family protein isoform 3 [Theobroma cacao]|uniref:Soul heme-binding family protein isoform 3 n=1 Tax=Theobroma cacao TaxID=3641 RepID=A0A061F177_THECC|nr:Soul heme-binding family protein isoform 3 [Theobroma cacao]